MSWIRKGKRRGRKATDDREQQPQIVAGCIHGRNCTISTTVLPRIRSVLGQAADKSETRDLPLLWKKENQESDKEGEEKGDESSG